MNVVQERKSSSDKPKTMAGSEHRSSSLPDASPDEQRVTTVSRLVEDPNSTIALPFFLGDRSV